MHQALAIASELKKKGFKEENGSLRIINESDGESVSLYTIERLCDDDRVINSIEGNRG